MDQLNISIDHIEKKLFELIKSKHPQYIEITELDGRFNKYELLYLVINLRKLNKIGVVEIDTTKLFTVSDVIVPFISFTKIGLI